MRMDEALEWAADYATRNKIFESEVNQRGYNAEKWAPPSSEEKARIITKLAKEVTTSENEQHLRNVMQDLHDAAMLENVPDLTRAINNIHSSLYQHLRRK